MKTFYMERDIFILPSSKAEKVLLYSPLRMRAALIENEDDAITNVLHRWESIRVDYPNNDTEHINHNHVILLLTQSCNLSCDYCYSRFSRSDMIMKYDILIKAINHVLSNSSNGEIKYFSFGGGGEPLMAWELLTKGIDYIRSNSSKETTRISIVTNGVLLSKKRLEYLKSMDVRINVSFDILPEIQNKQRKTRYGTDSYKLVSGNIKTMNALGLSVSFRTTITKDSVYMLDKMVRWTEKEFPFVKNLNIWPAIDPKEKTIDFYKDYIESFIQASELAWAYGIRLHNWLTVIDRFHSRFCQEDFCITPDGEIVTCLRTSSISDSNYDIFHIGSVSDNININATKEKNAMRILNAKLAECYNCPAKWSCAGICPSTRLMLLREKIQEYCSFTRSFLIRYIEFCIKHKLITSD